MSIYPHWHSKVVQGSRMSWILLILWLEMGLWYWSLRECKWPDETWTLLNPSVRNRGPQATTIPSPSHLLLLSDVNIFDSSSPSSVSPWLRSAARTLTGHAMSRGFAFLCKTFNPQGIIFLGNVISGGHLSRETELESLTDRFFDVFRKPSVSEDTPIWHLIGNHDVGLGYPTPYSRRARERFIEAMNTGSPSFVAANRAVDFGNHTFFLLDAPGFVDEDYIRIKAQKRLGSHASVESFRRPTAQGIRGSVNDADFWAPQRNGVMEYVHKLTQRRMDNVHSFPLILFSHIPLARPDDARCGGRRPGIRKGVGLGYQNMLSEAGSEWILGNLKPEVIFSANHLDHCEYVHSYLADIDAPLSSPLRVAVDRPLNESFIGNSNHERNIIRKAKEITVTTFSPFFMGVRRPGFQLLSLWNPIQDTAVPHRHSPVDYRLAQVNDLPTFSERPCLLPDLYMVYFYIYPVSILLTLLLLIIVNLRAVHIPRGTRPRLPRNPVGSNVDWSKMLSALGFYQPPKVESPKIYEVIEEEDEGELYDSQATIRPFTPRTPKPAISQSDTATSSQLYVPTSQTSSPLSSLLPSQVLPATLDDSEEDEEKGTVPGVSNKRKSTGNNNQTAVSRWHRTVTTLAGRAWYIVTGRGESRREREKRMEREQHGRLNHPGWKYVGDHRFDLTQRARAVSIKRILQVLKRVAKAFILGRAGNGSFASRLFRDCMMVTLPSFLFFFLLNSWLRY